MSRILFIDDKNSFVIKGISEKINAEQGKSLIFPLKKEEIEKLSDSMPEYLFACVYEDCVDKVKEYTYLKEICVGGNRKLFLMGFKEDIDKLQEIFPPRIMAGVFYRPANAGQITEHILEVLDNGLGREAKKNILLVDDSGTLLNALKGWLQDDYRVTMANSAISALFYLANNTPDLILLDYKMPVCSGTQLLAMLRSDAKTAKLPVIFLTGVEDEGSTEEILGLNPDGYMLKSTSREGILSHIEAFFENRAN